jgi:hypothetical protein
MEHNKSQSFDSFTKSLSDLADISTASIKSFIEGNIRTLDSVKDIIGGIGIRGLHKDSCGCGCCPPRQECPQDCLVSIKRIAYAGEKIIVPFKVKNSSHIQKHYRIGMRPLKEDNGNAAPSQPVLNKTEVTLEPNQSELVLMGINLANFQTGHTYRANIVVRENEINQNICFTLIVSSYFDVPEAKPWDERKYSSHFQCWQSHFYCDSPKSAQKDNSKKEAVPDNKKK